MKALKKYIAVITYRVSVDILGFPLFWKNYVYDYYYVEMKSKYIK
jgi:hypothetical protein